MFFLYGRKYCSVAEYNRKESRVQVDIIRKAPLEKKS